MAKELPGLKAARKRSSLSQRALGEKSGVSYVNISRIENGQRATPETTDKLARALGVKADELLGGPEGLPRKESGMTSFVRFLGLEPEPYFTEVPIGNQRVRDVYEAAYVRLVLAEQRAHQGSPELFDAELDDYVLRLVAAAKKLPRGGEKAELRERVSRIVARAAAVFEQEAERLDLETAAKRAESRKLLEVGQGLEGAA